MFDPLHKWLGIPASEQPANHYRLLGISLFESDPDVIDAATDKHLNYLHSFANGEQGPEAEKLANRLSRVRLQLTDPERKAAYDELLREQLAEAEQSDKCPPEQELADGGWYLRHTPAETHGPYSLDDLIDATKLGSLADQTELWHPVSTDSQWTQAFLFEAIDQHRPAQTAPLEDGNATDPLTSQPVVIRTKKRRRSSSYGCLAVLIQLAIPSLILAIPIYLVVTNKATFKILVGWNQQTDSASDHFDSTVVPKPSASRE